MTWFLAAQYHHLPVSRALTFESLETLNSESCKAAQVIRTASKIGRRVSELVAAELRAAYSESLRITIRMSELTLAWWLGTALGS